MAANKRSYYEKLLQIYEDVLKDEHWSKALYLQAAKKQLAGLCDQLRKAIEVEFGEGQTAEISPAKIAKQLAERAGVVEVYVSLYSVDGNNLKKWELMLSTLHDTMNSRPIYKREADAQALIRSKIHKENEAYCIAFVREMDIAQPFNGIFPKDKLGHELWMLKHVTLRSDNITRFIHVSGIYEYKEGQLIRLQDATDL